MPQDGLARFAMHTTDISSSVIRKFRNATPLDVNVHLDAESAARSYIARAFRSKTMSAFQKPKMKKGLQMEVKLKRMEEHPQTTNKLLTFKQTVNDISVYGSQVLVEINQQHHLVSLESKLSQAVALTTLARLSPYAAWQKVDEHFEMAQANLSIIPLLYHYYVSRLDRWALVYIIQDLPVARKNEPNTAKKPGLPFIVDVVLDAQSGEVLDVLPRNTCLQKKPSHYDRSEGTDDLDQRREFGISRHIRNKLAMIDTQLKVKTFDFAFKDVELQFAHLPGELIKHPPEWCSPGVSAHANTCQVAAFFREVLQRNGLDNKGAYYRSSINCIGSSDPRVWENAQWWQGQAMYGQVRYKDRLRSFASALDVVAHEIIHGIIEKISRLETQGEPGALNESYADIFAIIISNWHHSSIAEWNWQLGEDLSLHRLPIRDISDPAQYGNAAHYREWQSDRTKTAGGDTAETNVHKYSGIHSRAAYLIMSTIGKDGAMLFTKEEIAHLFYLAMERLGKTSTFADSAAKLLISAKSLFQSEDAQRTEKLNAITSAFQKVGISL